MRTDPHKPQSVIVRFLVDQRQVGLDVAIAVILPVAGQRVVAVTWFNLNSAVGQVVGANVFAHSRTSVRINSHLQQLRNLLNRNEFA